MSTDTLEQVAPTIAPYAWSLNDRCCADKGTRGHGGAVVVAEQAYHRWTKGDAELLFCNHHNRLVQEQLFIAGWSVESHPYHDKLDQPLDINHIDDED
jgi:hypothetical protein